MNCKDNTKIILIERTVTALTRGFLQRGFLGRTEVSKLATIAGNAYAMIDEGTQIDIGRDSADDPGIDVMEVLPRTPDSTTSASPMVENFTRYATTLRSMVLVYFAFKIPRTDERSRGLPNMMPLLM